MPVQRHWIFRPRRALTDSEEWQLIALGAAVVTAAEGNPPEVYLTGTSEDARALSSAAAANAIPLGSGNELRARNWVQQCPDLLEPVDVPPLRIRPFADGATLPAADADTIVLRPGSGFGTGHHPATRLLLELLIEAAATERFTAIFDFGTGSGILALAAAKLIPCAPITAMDIDTGALENAAEHVTVNGVGGRISLTDRLPESGTFDLVLANIYSGVLVDHEPALASRTQQGATLLISGILDEQWPAVRATYGIRWQIELERAVHPWRAARLRRKALQP